MILVNVFNDIVASMRATGSITDITASGSDSVITSVNSLVAGEVVTMDDVDYIVKSPTSSQFTVSGTVTASTWAAKAPYYDYGHPQEIANILTSKTGHQTKKYQKYPLIVFYTDVRIKRGDAKFYGKLERQFISIIGQSAEGYSSKQRYDNVITPILYPLYVQLLSKIRTSRYFMGVNPRVNHDLIERPFWGSTSKYGNIENMFNDPLDALEMANISILLRESTNC